MLLRPRKSRIYYLRRFFDYPITLSTNTLRMLGLLRTLRIGISYVKSALFPLKEERTLEQFFINRFGHELYNTFFKSYTEKVWGVPCDRIGAEWGAQRIKGLSVRAALAHALKQGRPSRRRRPRAERHRNFPDRALSVSQVRPWADVGGSRPPGPRKGRRDPHRLPGGQNPHGRLAGEIAGGHELRHGREGNLHGRLLLL